MVKKTSISLDEETFQLCEKYAAENSRSRSEFIVSAIQKYISDLELGRQENIIVKELADIPSKVMEEYRKEAIRNVRRTHGKINLDDLIARNNREFAERKIEERGDKNDDYESEFMIDDSVFLE